MVEAVEFFLLLLLALIYFIPTINAFVFNHTNKSVILALNLVFGLTGIGWLLLLFWSWQNNAGVSGKATGSMTEKPSLGGLLRIRLEALHAHQAETRDELLKKLDQLDREIAQIDELAREAGVTEPTQAEPQFETIVARSMKSLPDEKIVVAPELELVRPAPPTDQTSADIALLPLEHRLPALIEEETRAQAPLEWTPGVETATEPAFSHLAEAVAEANVPTVEAATEARLAAELVPPVTQTAAVEDTPTVEASAPPSKRIDWEALIGGSWLNIIGIVVLVVGLALLTEHTLRQFGPLGRVLAIAAVGATLLFGGVVLERREERYRIFARTLIGGGWAILYFTAYAAHNVEAARVIDNPVMSLVVMMSVAAGMILHSLVFRSQLVTGLAYGLAFFAVGLTPVTLQSLVACAILAASEVVLLRMLEWRTLALVAVAGVYLNHWRWIDAALTASANGAYQLDRNSYWLSLCVIAFYWVLMVVASLSRPDVSARDRLIQLTVSVANTVGMLGVSYLQVVAFGNQDLWLLAGAATTAYAGAAFACWRAGRVDLYRFNSAVAGALYAVALPLALNPLTIEPAWLSIYWLAGGLFAVPIGVALREPLTRAGGYLLCLAALWATSAIVLQGPLDDWRRAVWWMTPAIILGLLVLSERLQRAAARGALLREEGLILAPLWGYAAVAVLIDFAQKAASAEFVGLSLTAAGLAFFETGSDFSRLHLRAQGFLLLLVGAGEIATINLAEGVSPQALMVLPAVLAQAYGFWRMQGRTMETAPVDWLGGGILSASAVSLVVLLLWRKVDPALVALAWLPFAFALFETGARRRLPVLRLEAYAVAGAALVALFLHDLAPGLPAVGIPRALIVASGAAFYYYFYVRLSSARLNDWRSDAEWQFSGVFSAAGATLLATLAFRDVDRSIVALVWLLFASLHLEVGLRAARIGLRVEAYLLIALAFIDFLRIGVGDANLGEFAPPRLVLPVAAAIYYGLSARLVFAQNLRLVTESECFLPDAFSCAGSTLLAIVIWREADPTLIAPGWLALALALLETGVATRRDALHTQAYLLFACALAALFAIDLYDLSPAGAITTFIAPRPLIVGGGALVYYYLFWRLRHGKIEALDAPLSQRLADATSVAGTALLATLVWKESGLASVALGWAALALALYLVGRARNLQQLTAQAHVLTLGAFGRVFIANLVDLAESPLGLSHRVLTVVPIIALFYFLRAETMSEAQSSDAASGVFAPARLSRFYSWGAMALLVALLRFELGRADWIMGISPVILALLVLGERRDDIDFRFQSYVLAVLGVARAFVSNVYLTGDYYVFGLSERLVTILPLFITLTACAGVASRYPREPEVGAASRSRFVRALQFFDRRADETFALLAAVVGLALIYCEAPESWVTSLWALEALLLIVAGFSLARRSLRYCGLFILLICVLKLTVLDLSGVDSLYRILSYIALGVILLAASFIYTRHRDVVRKYM